MPVATFGYSNSLAVAATLLPLLDIDARLGMSPTWLLSILLATGLTQNWFAASDQRHVSRRADVGQSIRWLCPTRRCSSLSRSDYSGGARRIAALGMANRDRFYLTLPSVNLWYVAWLVPAVAFGDACDVRWWFALFPAASTLWWIPAPRVICPAVSFGSS